MTGNETILSSGLSLLDPMGIAVEADGKLLVTSSASIIRIDPSIPDGQPGNQTTVSGCCAPFSNFRGIAVVPEPSEFWMLGAGIAFLAALGRRRIQA